jgi:hypothetical protein
MSKRKMDYDLERFWKDGRRVEDAETLMRWLHRDRSALTTKETELVGLAILDGLTEAFPDRVEDWKTRFYFAFDAAEDVRLLTNEQTDGRAGWNDYHMCRWFISHDQKEIMAAINRIGHPDPDVGGTCIWMLRSVALKHTGLDEQIRECVYSDELKPECLWLRERFDEVLGPKALRESRKAEQRNHEAFA